MAGKQHGDTWRPGRGALPVLMVLYALVLLVIAGVNRAGAEHWWLGALNLYLPQALWALPALPLLLLSPLAGRYWPCAGRPGGRRRPGRNRRSGS